MPALVRVGDTNEVGGKVTDGPTTVFANGIRVCTHVSGVTPHPCCGSDGCSAHCRANTVTGSSTVFAEGKPVVYVGVGDTCGHSRAMGSPNVFVSP